MSEDVTIKKTKRYGWIKDLPDTRDKYLAAPRTLMAPVLPEKVDMRPGMPAIWDQGSIGSCTAHAALALYQYTAKEQRQRDVNYSRLYEYYCTRILEGTIDWDSGASIRNSIKALNSYGVCLESDWPYKVTKFSKKPSAACFKYGEKKLVEAYARVQQTEFDVKSCLAQGNPISFGFSVFESFEGDEISRTGIMRHPEPWESVIGGHAVVLVGYDDKKKLFLVRNSWSSDWGEKGHFWMPYDLLLNPDFADDFWTLLSVP